MKKLLLSLFAGIGSLLCLAQKPLYLKNASYLEYLNIPKSEKPFVGGLSAIEYNPEDGSWSVVSDRDNTGKNSYIFHPDLEDGNLNGKNWKKSVVADLVDVESYRFNPKLKTYFFAAESEKRSYVGQVTGRVAKSIGVVDSTNAKVDNRGIESLTFMPESGDLWYALESGRSTSCSQDRFTTFYQIPYDDKKYTAKPDSFKYEIDRCSCLTGDEFDGSNGNGVSEILYYDSDHLLILERCYNKKSGDSQALLVLGRIDVDRKLIVREDTLFDFKNVPNGIKPGNLEGMTWGPREKDFKTLYVISDDNLKEIQQTRLFVLSEKEDAEIYPRFGEAVPMISPQIVFAENGSIISEMPNVINNDSISVKVGFPKNDFKLLALNKRFDTSIENLLNTPDSLILRMIGFPCTSGAINKIKEIRRDSYEYYLKSNKPYEIKLNNKPFPLTWSAHDFSWVGVSRIEHVAKNRERQTLELSRINLESAYMKSRFEKTKGDYKSWRRYRQEFDNLYTTYSAYARQIDQLRLKKHLLKLAGESCECSKYTIDEQDIDNKLCRLLSDIKLSQTQLCAISGKVIKENAPWMTSWLWYSNGKPQLNPFGKVSIVEFNSDLNKRLAIAEAQLKMYEEFSKHNRTNKEFEVIEKYLKPRITALAADISTMKVLKGGDSSRVSSEDAWLESLAETSKVVNKVSVYTTNEGTIHWMNHYNAKDEYQKMNSQEPLPERVYEKDVVHGIVHNLTSKQKISSKETVTKAPLRTEFDISVEPLGQTLKSVWYLTTEKISPLKAKQNEVQGFAFDSIKSLPVRTKIQMKVFRDCTEDLKSYDLSKPLIEWLAEQTEPPIAEMEAAYEAFDEAESVPVYRSQETLISESRSAEGTNVISYEIFEEGKDKPLVKDKYQTYNTVRFWPFVGANYVFGSRASAIFDPTTNTFKTYTEMDNIEVFAGAKWYWGPSNVTRTRERSRFIRKNVGQAFQWDRGNHWRGKTFLFFGLGVRHKFLKNYGLGGGYDFFPGFSAQIGANIYFDKKYQLVNGVVRKDFDVMRLRPFIGLSIDANVVTQFISLF